MFVYLHKDNNVEQQLDLQAFQALIGTFGKTIEGLPEVNVLKERMPRLYTWGLVQTLEDVVRSPRFELVMDAILLLNMCGSVYETLSPSQNSDYVFEIVDLVVSVVFVVEV